MIYLGILSDSRAWKSKSPKMHKKALKEANLIGNYQAFEIKKENLKEAVNGLFALGFTGLNVTVPYKEDVIPYLCGISEEAKKIVAVNTLLKTDNGFWGYNTDAYGFLYSLLVHKNNIEDSFLVYGAGGASRAVLYALKSKYKNIFLLARNEEKAIKLATEFEVIAINYQELQNTEFKVLINTSAASTIDELKEELIFLKNINLKNNSLIMDINYGRENNYWQQLANNNNYIFQDGLVMLALQAQEAFKIWTGKKLNKEIFMNSLLESLNKC